MLRRRDFLAGSISLAATSACLAQDADHVSPRSHGAVGDGATDDAVALSATFAQAYSRHLPVDGGDAVYAVRGRITVVGQRMPWVKSLRLKQLDPVNGRVTLYLGQCEGVRIDQLAIDVGSGARAGDMNSTFGLWVDGGSNHRISNVDVTGDGKNSLIAIWNTSNSIYHELTVHDSKFNDAAATDDIVQGIWMYRNSDCVLSNPVVKNLTGNASYPNMAGRSTVFANLRSRGIAMGGNVRVSILNPTIVNVDQGIDFTGSDGNRHCVVDGGSCTDCGSVGVKFSNSAVGCQVSRPVRGATRQDHGARPRRDDEHRRRGPEAPRRPAVRYVRVHGIRSVGAELALQNSELRLP